MNHGLMKVLITGGMGGIGWEMVLALASAPGVQVVTMGRSGVPAGRFLPANVVHEVGSIQDGAFLQRVMGNHGITHLIHAAGARTRDCDSHPLLAVEANLIGTNVTFRAANAIGTMERAIYFSSAAIYGRQLGTITEEQPIAPTSNYAITKAASEVAVRGHTEGSSFQTAILRPAFVLGKRSSGRLPDFVRQAVTNSLAGLHFSERFHLHWAADLAAAAIHLLRAPLQERVQVFHLPGFDCNLSDFGAAVKRAAEERERSPTLTIQVDPSARFPASLDVSRFQQTASSLRSTQVVTMIGEIMDEALSRTAPSP